MTCLPDSNSSSPKQIPFSKRNGISQIAVHCFDCYHGRYELVTRDEEYPMMDGSRMVLPRVNYLRCVECGEEVLTSESEQYIEEFGPPKVDVRALWAEYERRMDGDGLTIDD